MHVAPTEFRLSKLSTVQDFLQDEDLTKSSFKEAFLLTPKMYQERQGALKEKEVILKVEDLSKHYVNKKSFWGKPKSVTKAVD